ncbi:hypothetical protein BBI10_04345 [Pseudomonas graminis]|uniref:Uncharacterized protein n=1 Tax=Pseudomonas graminis TaxID=158627 RepID=A0A1C2EDC6_9PSED|nr:hypothetical protein BBI10_04345 [Pseudomonas graminis]
MPSAISTMANPANTTAYRSFFSNQPVLGSWCDLCQPQPQPCMMYLCANTAKPSMPITVAKNTRALIIGLIHASVSTSDREKADAVRCVIVACRWLKAEIGLPICGVKVRIGVA